MSVCVYALMDSQLRHRINNDSVSVRSNRPNTQYSCVRDCETASAYAARTPHTYKQCQCEECERLSINYYGMTTFHDTLYIFFEMFFPLLLLHFCFSMDDWLRLDSVLSLADTLTL